MRDNIHVMTSRSSETAFIFIALIFQSDQQICFNYVKMILFTQQLTTNCKVNECYKL